MLNRIAFIFSFFHFFGEEGGESWGSQRVSHSICRQPCSSLVSISFLILCFLAAVSTLTARIYRQDRSARVLPSQGLSFFFSHAFFSALCFYPLKHATLIFGEEDQA